MVRQLLGNLEQAVVAKPLYFGGYLEMERRSLLVQHAAVESVPHQRVFEHDLTGFVLDVYQIKLMQARKPIIGRSARDRA
jgi:hypothetical protein